MALQGSSFSEATRVTALSSHTYTANFPPDWCIGSVPHGGFVTSCFMQVASKHFSTTLLRQDQPHTIALHLDFLRRTEVGSALFTVKDVKLGRQTSVIHVSLSQAIGGGIREEVVGYLTNSNIDKESGPSISTRWALEPAAAPATLSAFDSDKDPGWREQKTIPFIEFRKATQKVRMFFPTRGQVVRGAVDQWISFNAQAMNGKAEMFTNESLGFVCDMWPQLIEVHGQDNNNDDGAWGMAPKGDPYAISPSPAAPRTARMWFPTVLLNLEVKKALPQAGVEWLFCRVRAKMIKDGRYDLEIIILDEGGDIVALSHHIALAVPASRNLAKRSGREGDAKI